MNKTATSFCQSGTAVTTLTCSLGFTPTVGNLLFANGGGYSGSTCVLSGTGYTSVNAATANGGCLFQGQETVGGSPPTSITLTSTTAAFLAIGSVYEVSNQATSPIDSSGISASPFTSTSTCSTGSVTPNQANDLLIMFSMNLNGTQVGSASTLPVVSLTTTPSINSAAGLAAFSAVGLYTGTIGITPTWTWGAAQNNACEYALIAPSGSLPPPSPISGAKCLTTVNGQQFSAGCRPYDSTSPWNIVLPDSPAQTSALPAGQMTGHPTTANIDVGPGTSNDFGFPVWFASLSDPTWTVTCTSGGACGTVPASIHAPSNIARAGGSDGHLAIVDSSTGVETDFYQAQINAGALTLSSQYINQDNFSTVTRNGGVCTNANFGLAAGVYPTGCGVSNPSTTSGSSLGTEVRAQELQAAFTAANATGGFVPHALPLVVPCTTNPPVLPVGTSSASICSGTGLHIGDHVQYTPTCATIWALYPASYTLYQATMLCTMHKYGGYVMDTSGGTTVSGGFSDAGRTMESPEVYIATSNTVPMIATLALSGFSHIGDSMLSNGGSGGGWEDADASIQTNLRVVNPCYGLGTCTI